MKILRIIDELEFNGTIEAINNLYANNPTLREEDNIRNTCLSAMLFMLAAKDKGWDTCPMHVKNTEIIKEIYNIPENHQPVLLITLGKAVEEKNVREDTGSL